MTDQLGVLPDGRQIALGGQALPRQRTCSLRIIACASKLVVGATFSMRSRFAAGEQVDAPEAVLRGYGVLEALVCAQRPCGSLSV